MLNVYVKLFYLMEYTDEIFGVNRLSFEHCRT